MGIKTITLLRWRPAAAVAADDAPQGVHRRARNRRHRQSPRSRRPRILVRNGRIEAVGTSVKIPAGAQRIDVAGKTIIPGLINAHGHVSNLDQLGLYARYGVTTVFSLGGDKEIELRDQTRAEQQTPALMRSRLFIAGPIPDIEDRGRSAQGGRRDRRRKDRHRQDPPRRQSRARQPRCPSRRTPRFSTRRTRRACAWRSTWSRSRTGRPCCGWAPTSSRTASATRRSMASSSR